jgi:hypothetical protein
MTVRFSGLLLLPLLATGCTSTRPAAVHAPETAPVAALSPTKVVETRYEVRGYRDPANPAVRHEPHAVFRRTRVPLNAADELATAPRTSAPPASVAPLPASAELAAELATQREITGAIRAMQASVAETEKQMQEQYALLLRQSAEVLKAHKQMEAGRRQEQSAPAAAPVATTAGSAAATW